MDAVKIRLDEKHFAALVRGGTVKTQGVELFLADIGFTVMEEAIDTAKYNPDCHYQEYDDGTSS